MAEVLVTGGTGAVGRFVHEELTRTGHSPVVFARQLPPDVRGVAGSIVDLDDIRRAIATHCITHVIHLAAVVGSVYETDVATAIDTNVRGTANVLTAAAEAKVQRVVAMSSKAVYGDIGGRHGPPHHSPIAEDDLPMQPFGLYGLAKEFGERFGGIVHRRSGLDVIAIRSGTTFGPGKGAHHGVGSASSTLVELPWAGRSARIALGGDAVDDFVYYADLARGLVQACFATGELQPVYHLSSGVGLTLHDIADAVRRRIPSADIEIGPGPIFNGLDHNLHCVLSIDAARRDFSFRPTTLPEWVDDYLGRLDATTRVRATNPR